MTTKTLGKKGYCYLSNEQTWLYGEMVCMLDKEVELIILDLDHFWVNVELKS